MTKPSLTLALLLVFLVRGVLAAPIELTFEQAVLMAQDKPASVVMSHERVQQAAARLAQARSSLLPQLTGTASEQRRTLNLNALGFTLPNTRDPKVGPFNTFDARLKLTQELFDAETMKSLQYARSGQSLAIEQKRKQQQDTMALVATLYIEAKRAKDNIALGETFKHRDTRELVLARSQEKLGTGSELAADEAKSRLADSQRYVKAAQAQAVERQLDLSQALDLPVDELIDFKNSPTLPPEETPEEEIFAVDFDSHPDVAVARETLAQHQAHERVIKAGYAPKITAEGDYGASGNLPSDSFATYNFGGQIQMPFFEGANRKRRVDEAKHQVEESHTQLEDVKIKTQARARSAAEAVKRTWAAVESQKTALDVAEKELALSQHRLDIGVGSELELIEQQAKTAQARDDWQEAIAAYQMARVSLAQALGRMESLVTKS